MVSPPFWFHVVSLKSWGIPDHGPWVSRLKWYNIYIYIYIYIYIFIQIYRYTDIHIYIHIYIYYITYIFNTLYIIYIGNDTRNDLDDLGIPPMT